MRRGIRVLLACWLCAAKAQTPQTLARYSACKLAGGPAVVETSPLASGVTSRSVKTVHGPVSIALEGGSRVMFAFAGEDFYANVKAERLPSATYAEEKRLLIESFDYSVVGGGDVERNYKLKRVLHGFEAAGADRLKLEGGVLGIYQLFDDRAHEVLTIYFLNQDADQRHFQTVKEYQSLRDQFLESYTSCLAG